MKPTSSRTLYLLRHATAPWAGGRGSDFNRNVDQPGLNDAGWVGRYLKARNAHVDVALCSSALRARQTLDELNIKLQRPMRIFSERSLYDSGAKEVFRSLSALSSDDHTVLMVGHNPWILDVMCALSPDGEARSSVMRNGYPPCGLTELRFESTNWDIRRATAYSATFTLPQGCKISRQSSAPDSE